MVAMNEQKPPNAIEWTRVWGRRGWTWNPVGGCAHDCQWLMPSGDTAICYAKTIAERVAPQTYYNGFAAHYWRPDVLNEPLKLKEPGGIFLDSMSDLMGTQVPDDQVRTVLDVCRRADWHIFFLLTKNAPRLLKFEFPRNVWVGVSSAPDFMYGKPLVREQQQRYMRTALRVLSSLPLGQVTWMSFEPLSWDVSALVREFPHALDWAVVGAASSGRKEYPPRESDLRALLGALDRTPIFYKGNLRSLPFAAANWRAEFPPEPGRVSVPLVQQTMF